MPRSLTPVPDDRKRFQERMVQLLHPGSAAAENMRELFLHSTLIDS